MNILSYVHLRNIYRSTGVGRVARELTEHLAAMPDVQVQILADRADHARILPNMGAPWPDLRYHLFDRDTSKQQMHWFLWNRPGAEDFWPETDIVHCSAESYVPVRKARLVVTCHDAQHFEPGAHRLTPWLLKQRFKWKLLFERLASSASMFHMISHFAAERTAHFFPKIADRLRVIPNAASESFFQPPTEHGLDVLRKLGVDGRPYLLVPGGLQHRKNANLILEAWPHLRQMHPDVKLVVINHSDPVYLERAKTFGDSLVLGGFQDEPQLVALYSTAQLVWFPTLYDGFGMPVVEAMAAGTPVVSSNTTGIPEVAGNAARLLSPQQPADHVAAIDDLLKSASTREDLIRLGRERAANFRWQHSANKLKAAFDSLM